MKNSNILITGGCGFVGRNLLKKLIQEEKNIWVIDDLSIGQHPDKWLDKSFRKSNIKKNYLEYSFKGIKINFLLKDAIDVFSEDVEKKDLPKFNTIFHLASIVGGRELIDGDPILVGKDMAIDSIFFYWLTRKNRYAKRVLYASSSAAYPINLQKSKNFQALKEDLIDFKNNLGVPDMTYGWSKLTGEFLSRIASRKYSLPITCVRPFSGYGEDQDFSYPIPTIARRIALREDPLIVWGTGKQGRDFVHINDCIDAFFVIMDKIQDGSACNIGSGRLTSFIEVIKIFAEIEGYNPKIKKLLDKPVGVSFRYADISKLQSIGWAPKISREQGFARVLKHIKESRL